ncbi:DUF1569 domain-containing protein [Aquiflexum sp.]|uniref:DUF1569 domain-containing protein n=1 Tax=Aquiflexum sp. TaxID=1872584 RepID=UPI003593BE67
MKTIFNEEDYAEIRKRIMALSASSLRKWGKMDLQQMLLHCTAQLKLAVGEIPSKPQGPSLMRSGLGKWLLFSNLPWPKGAKTPDEMNVETNSFLVTDIELEKKDLLNYLEEVKRQDELYPHPFFGNLKRDEWSRLIYKHLDHHLKQFGSR